MLPDIDRRARDTIHGTVKIDVRVRVDARGRVDDAAFDHRPSSNYLGKLTLDAARQWRFRAGAPGEWILRFQLLREDTKVTAEQL